MDKPSANNTKTQEHKGFATKPAFSQPKKREKAASEYKKSLVEKQELKHLYGLTEKQFKKYVQESLSKIRKVANISDELVKLLEKRLDNVVFRLGFAKTRAQARQMVSHAYFLVDGKPVNIPSFQMQKGNVVSIKETKKKKVVFEKLSETLNKNQTPLWLNLDKKDFSATMVGEPTLAEVNVPVEISLIFEFYSR